MYTHTHIHLLLLLLLLQTCFNTKWMKMFAWQTLDIFNKVEDRRRQPQTLRMPSTIGWHAKHTYYDRIGKRHWENKSSKVSSLLNLLCKISIE